MHTKKVLVTGGSGFIGSHLVDALLALGYDVSIFDIAAPKFLGTATYVKGDVLGLAALTDAARGMNAVYHLAAEANVNYYHERPRESTILNTIGTVNVLEAARANAVSRVLFASTEWVYQGSKETMVDEETQLYPNAPDHIYTSSKIASELYCINYQKLYDVDFTIMRFGIPFGERARLQTVTPIFISKARKGEMIMVDGSEENFRQFIYVKDLAEGCVACLADAAKNQIINLNGAKKIRILDIITSLESIMGKKISYTVQQDRAGNYNGRMVSIEKAKKLLNWQPTTTYEDGLRKYYEWYISNATST